MECTDHADLAILASSFCIKRRAGSSPRKSERSLGCWGRGREKPSIKDIPQCYMNVLYILGYRTVQWFWHGCFEGMAP